MQLEAIAVFVSAASGQRFLIEFLEVGGVLTVLDILALDLAAEGVALVALRLLQGVAAAGRKYKELLCDSDGELHRGRHSYPS